MQHYVYPVFMFLVVHIFVFHRAGPSVWCFLYVVNLLLQNVADPHPSSISDVVHVHLCRYFKQFLFVILCSN